MAFRVDENVTRGKPVTLEFDGRQVEAFEGETVAAALIANGISHFTRDREGNPRGVFCNMGVCFDCLVSIQDAAGGDDRRVRACQTPVLSGMRIRGSGTAGR